MTRRPPESRAIYKVIFQNRGEVYEIHARGVAHESMLGFLEVEGLLFGQRSQVVVDPSEDRLRHEFAGVERLFIPVHAVIRIDQVEKQGTSRITAQGKGEGMVTLFPGPFMGKPPGESK
jgi:hypothetical protein